ncbi:hypothetical protein [Acinetobacter phage vB_AbaM_fThrA]|nr:hypothetical protein [Acinetobacter phage vB_AbaM_fThrA]
MNKLELAQQYMVLVFSEAIQDFENIELHIKHLPRICFDMAEAMLAENEKRQDKSRPEVLGGWQPDWSQAPDGANWWAMDFDGSANWFSYKPYISSEYPDEWIYNGRNHGGLGIEYWRAMPFDYKGGWQDSLRKRP